MTCYLVYIFSVVAPEAQDGDKNAEGQVGQADKVAAEETKTTPVKRRVPAITKLGVTWDYSKMIYLLQPDKQRYAGGVVTEVKDVVRTEFIMGYARKQDVYTAKKEGGLSTQKSITQGTMAQGSALVKVLTIDHHLVHMGASYGMVFYEGRRVLSSENHAPFYEAFRQTLRYRATDTWLALQMNFSTKLWRVCRIGSTLYVKRFLPSAPHQEGTPWRVPDVGDKRLALYPSLHLFVAVYPLLWTPPRQLPTPSTQ